MSPHLEIVFKPTLQCNAACAYCNVLQTRSVSDVSLVERLFLQLSDYMMQNEHWTANILWHGGEPTLLGEGFYRQVLELDRRVFESSPSHVMQSNLTILTEPLADLLGEFLTGGGIGTSLDPFEDYRRLKNGDSYIERWYDGFELAKSRGLHVRNGLRRSREIIRPGKKDLPLLQEPWCGQPYGYSSGRTCISLRRAATESSSMG